MKEALRLAQGRTASDKGRRRLSWLFNVNLQQVRGRMIFDPERPPRFSVAPLSLLTAMWVQLALAIAGDKQFVECKHCHRLMEISTEDRGTSVSTIADRVATNSRTVRRWVTAFEKERRSAAAGDLSRNSLLYLARSNRVVFEVTSGGLEGFGMAKATPVLERDTLRANWRSGCQPACWRARIFFRTA